MDPIANIDGLVLILRQRLQERARVKAGARSSQSGATLASALDNVQALASVEGVDDHQLGRALIQGLLADQFGRGLINDARFQQVVDRVVETMQAEPRAATLMAGLLKELRAAA